MLCATNQSVSASETASARKSAPTTTITQQQRNTNTTATREGQRERESSEVGARHVDTLVGSSCCSCIERERVSASNIYSTYISYLNLKNLREKGAHALLACKFNLS